MVVGLRSEGSVLQLWECACGTTFSSSYLSIELRTKSRRLYCSSYLASYVTPAKHSIYCNKYMVFYMITSLYDIWRVLTRNKRVLFTYSKMFALTIHTTSSSIFYMVSNAFDGYTYQRFGWTWVGLEMDWRWTVAGLNLDCSWTWARIWLNFSSTLGGLWLDFGSTMSKS